MLFAIYVICSILLYGLEAWTLKVNTISKIETFKMWCYRLLLKISCTEKVTNNDIHKECIKECHSKQTKKLFTSDTYLEAKM